MLRPAGVPAGAVDRSTAGTAASGAISGVVLDQTGAPLAGASAEVHVFDGGWTEVGAVAVDVTGAYVVGGLASGDYYVVTVNHASYVDEGFEGVPCPLRSCLGSGLTAISVTDGATTSGVDFHLALGGRISGTIVDEISGVGLEGLEVDFYDAASIAWLGWTVSGVDGAYTSGTGLPAGSYLVAAGWGGPYLRELYDNVPCWSSCDVDQATQIVITEGADAAGIDFDLSVGGEISGLVRDSETGLGIPAIGVDVIAPDSSWWTSVTTDPDGSYTTAANIPPGGYFVGAWDPSGRYVTVLFDGVACIDSCSFEEGTIISVEGGSTTAGVDFELPLGGSISGALSDAATGLPIADSRVRGFDSTGNHAFRINADASGQFRASNPLPPGDYFLVSENWAGYLDELYDDQPCWNGCDPTSGTPVTVVAETETSGIQFALDPGGRISGTVTDQVTGLGIESVQVEIRDLAGNWLAYGYTASDGTYTTDRGLAAGSYVAYARDYSGAGHLSEYYDDVYCPFLSCDIASATPIEVWVGATTAGIDFELVPGGQISGTVVDSVTGLGIGDVQVSIYDGGGNWLTYGYSGTDGSYVTYEGLPAGTYYAFAEDGSGTGYISEIFDDVQCPNLSCDTGLATPIEVTAGSQTSGIDFALERGGVISGVAVDSGSGVGLDDVWIRIYDSSGAYVAYAWSNASGSYRMNGGLPSGTYFARATDNSGAGYVQELFDNLPCATSCSVTSGTPILVTGEGEIPGIDFALDLGGFIAGTVVDETTGAGMVNVQVRVYDAAGSYQTYGWTRTDGTYTSYQPLPPGTYFARATDQSGTAHLQELYDGIACPFGCSVVAGTPIGVAAGATTSGVDFALTAGGRLAGHVTDAASGASLANVWISVYDASGYYRTGVYSDANGEFLTWLGLPAGVYHALAWDYSGGGRVTQLFEGISCPGGACDVTSGAPIDVSLGAVTDGVDFALELPGAIAGVVTDSGTGVGLPEAEVHIYDANGAQVAMIATLADGSYQTGAVLPTGTYFAVAYDNSVDGRLAELFAAAACAFGCDVTNGTAISVVNATTTSGIDFALDLPGRIAGTVTDSVSGLGVPGVYVRVYDAAGSQVSVASTDGNGDYLTPAGLPGGTYYAVARDDSGAGHIQELWDDLPCAFGCIVTDGTPIEVTLGSTTPGIDFALEPGGRISGRVTDVVSGAGLLSTYVAILNSDGNQVSHGWTDSNGDYLSGFLPSVESTGQLATVLVDPEPATYHAVAYPSSDTDHMVELYDDMPCAFGCDETAGTPIGVNPGETTSGIDFGLALGGRIAGMVTDSATGVPIQHVEIWIYDASGDYRTWGYTDSAGQYSSNRALPAGTYFARAWDYSGTGHLSELFDGVACSSGCDVTSGTPILVNAGETAAGIDFALETGGAISGVVTDSEGGSGIPAVEVDIYDADGNWRTYGWTDTAGSFVTYQGLPTGTYFAVATDYSGTAHLSELYDGVPCYFGCELTDGTPISVSAGATTPGIDFSLDPGGSVTGTVTDAASGFAIQDVRVDVYDSGGTWRSNTYSDSAGQYSTSALPAGNYYARATDSSGSGYLRELYDDIPCALGCNPLEGLAIPVVAGSTTAGIDFALAQGGWVSGTVADAGSGAGISDVNVDVFDAEGNWYANGWTDAAGFYSTSQALPAGTYFAVAHDYSGTGHLSQLFDGVACWPGCDVTTGTPVLVSPGATSSGIDFALEVGGFVTGTVTDSVTGLGIPNIEIAIYDAAGSLRSSGTTDPAGNYVTWDGLATGTYYAIAGDGSGGSSAYLAELYDGVACHFGCEVTDGTPISVITGSTSVAVDFSLERGGQVSGTVTDSASGAGLSNVRVDIYDSSGFRRSLSWTAADGSYTSRGLPSGTYRARATDYSGNGYLRELFDDIPCATGCAVLDGSPIEVAAGATSSGIDFALDQGGWISGTVTDAASGLGIPDVEVDIYDAGWNAYGYGWTDSSGSFITSGGLPAGTYYAVAYDTSGTGHQTQLYSGIPCSGGCDLALGTSIEVTQGATTLGIDFSLEAGGQIAGVVTDEVTGVGVAEVQVVFYDAAGNWVSYGWTDSSGAFLSNLGVPAGTYYARATDYSGNGYLRELYDDIPCPAGCDVTTGTPIEVTAGAVTPGIDFALGQGGRVSGTVIDAETGLGISDVEIDFYDAGGVHRTSAVTGADGTYTTGDSLPAGSYFALATDTSGAGRLSELYDGLPCASGCDPTLGTAIVVENSVTTPGIDFALADAGIFQDGFETQDFTRWSTWVPQL